MKLHVTLCALALALSFAASLRAQERPAMPSSDTSAVCWPARPEPRCKTFLLTNFGAYVDLSGPSVVPNRVVWDIGVMVNTSPCNALGASFVVEESGFATTGILSHWVAEPGVTLRYRRWSGRRGSVDLGIGGLLGRRGQHQVFGLVGFNLAPWIGAALRAYDDGRMSVGVALADAPGAILGAVAGLFAGVAGAVKLGP